MLVRVDACGVCGTDIKKIQKGPAPGPRIFGHEIAGSVARRAAGAALPGGRPRGRSTTTSPAGPVSTASAGAYAQCETTSATAPPPVSSRRAAGSRSTSRRMDWIVERGAIPIPDGVLPEEAAFVEPVNTCLKAVRKAGVGKGQTVLVVGQGPIGCCSCSSAGGRGRTSSRPTRCPTAWRWPRLGRGGGARRARRRAARGAGAHRRTGADCVFLAAFGQARSTRPLTPRGRAAVSWCSPPHRPARRRRLDLGALCAAEKEILTSYSASVDVQDLAAQLVFGREVRVRELVTHRFPLEEAPRGGRSGVAAGPPASQGRAAASPGQRVEVLATKDEGGGSLRQGGRADRERGRPAPGARATCCCARAWRSPAGPTPRCSAAATTRR